MESKNNILIVSIIVSITFLFMGCNHESDRGSNHNRLKIVEIKNNPDAIIKPSDNLPFFFDDATHKDYDSLLNNIINPQMDKRWGRRWRTEDTWTKTTKLRIWVKSFLDRGGWGEGNKWSGDYTRELYRITDILKNQKDNKDGLCSYYATFFMHACLATGITNRRVGWWRPGGDQLNEVYIPELQKWIVVSPLYNTWFSNLQGTPLSLIELHQYNHRKEMDSIITQRDYQSTFPDPEIRKNWLAGYSWDVYFWNKTGRAYATTEKKAYRYENPLDWPYKHYESKLVEDATQDEDLINFDIASIKVKASIAKDTLQFNITDHSLANLKEFAWLLKNEEGALLTSKPFKNTSQKIGLKDYSPGNYSVCIYALNQRGGKSNKVIIRIQKAK